MYARFSRTILITDCLVGVVVASAIADKEILDSIPGSDKFILYFAIRDFLVVIMKSGLEPD